MCFSAPGIDTVTQSITRFPPSSVLRKRQRRRIPATARQTRKSGEVTIQYARLVQDTSSVSKYHLDVYRMSLRTIIGIAAAIAAVTLAHAQGYPARVVKIVSPFVPGGPGDLLPRAVAAGLSPLFGQPVIVENRPGATTIIAMQAVAKAPPDGYTLVFTSVSSFISVTAYKSLPYDPIPDSPPAPPSFPTPPS